MLHIGILTPEKLPGRVKNSDIRQNIDLLALSRFTDRAIRCHPLPLLSGNAGVLAPMVASRALEKLSGLGVPGARARAAQIMGSSLVARLPRRLDAIIGHGLHPILLTGRRNVPPLLWGPGYMADEYRRDAGLPADRSADDARLRSFSAEKTAGIFLTTDEAVDRWRARIAVPSDDRVFCIPYFMPRSPRAREAAWTRREAGPVRFAFVGRQARRKNLPKLIAAFDGLGPAAHESLLLTVVSDLRDGHVDLDRPYVRHFRELDNAKVHALMSASHVYCMPSKLESFGMVFVEALSRGCVVVAPKRPAQIDMLGNAGRFVDPDDVEEITEQLRDLLDVTQWSELGQLSVQRYRERFAPDLVAERFAIAAEAIADGSPRGPGL